MTLTPTDKRPPMPAELVGAMIVGARVLTDGQGGEINALVVVAGPKAFAVYWERSDRRFIAIEVRLVLDK
jgi:hypothetical protein